MTLLDIEQWLNRPPKERDFSTGRQLYDQFGANVTLKKTFHTKGKTAKNVKCLADELAIIYQREVRSGNIHREPSTSNNHGRRSSNTGGNAKKAANKEPGKERAANGSKDGEGKKKSHNKPKGQKQKTKASTQKPTTKQVLAKAPDKIREAQLLWKQKRNEADALKQNLIKKKPLKQRKKENEKIVALYDMTYRLWDIVDHWKRTGDVLPLPDDDNEHQISKVDKSDKGQVHKRLTNLRTYIAKAGKRNTPEEKVASWRKELKELEAMI